VCSARRIGNDSTEVRLADLNEAGYVLRESQSKESQSKTRPFEAARQNNLPTIF
jgi:hypothetical protein